MAVFSQPVRQLCVSDTGRLIGITENGPSSSCSPLHLHYLRPLLSTTRQGGALKWSCPGTYHMRYLRYKQ
ncbi:hypothetical protein AAFF_G00386150 [Aldrovandia affinis]|uniref:Uncharacterized protein n=1 Tax=Aldrovandia affinis TaxID=143900 RepID=A0AAD7WME5_9TELE|nr:hypothetical protein AAFF_G00386150 [Aldrovandia affinis]